MTSFLSVGNTTGRLLPGSSSVSGTFLQCVTEPIKQNIEQTALNLNSKNEFLKWQLLIMLLDICEFHLNRKRNLAKYNFGHYLLLPSLSPRLVDVSDFLCAILKGYGGKDRRKSQMCALLSLWKKGNGRAGHGQITSTSLSALASAPGELGLYRRNQKTWVPVPVLPLTTYVTLGKLPDISKFQFHYSILWRLTMIYINVICSLPTSIQTIFYYRRLGFLPIPLKSHVLTCAFFKQSRWLHYFASHRALSVSEPLFLPSACFSECKTKWTNLHAGPWDTAIPFTLLSPPLIISKLHAWELQRVNLVHESSDSIDKKDLGRRKEDLLILFPPPLLLGRLTGKTESKCSSLECSVFLRGLTGNLDPWPEEIKEVWYLCLWSVLLGLHDSASSFFWKCWLTFHQLNWLCLPFWDFGYEGWMEPRNTICFLNHTPGFRPNDPYRFKESVMLCLVDLFPSLRMHSLTLWITVAISHGLPAINAWLPCSTVTLIPY